MIAQSAYEVAISDLSAAAETAYYPVLIDQVLIDVNAENISNLGEILEVTCTPYTAQQLAQKTLASRINLSQAHLQQHQCEVNRANVELCLSVSMCLL